MPLFEADSWSARSAAAASRSANICEMPSSRQELAVMSDCCFSSSCVALCTLDAKESMTRFAIMKGAAAVRAAAPAPIAAEPAVPPSAPSEPSLPAVPPANASPLPPMFWSRLLAASMSFCIVRVFTRTSTFRVGSLAMSAAPLVDLGSEHLGQLGE
jgi:hypothetical protein